MIVDTVVNSRVSKFGNNLGVSKKETFTDRLHDTAKLYGVSKPAEFSRFMRVSPQTGHKWWTGRTANLRARDLYRIADKLKVRGRWLLDGVGPMRATDYPDPDEQRALDLYRAFQPQHEKWREDWLAQGSSTLQNLTQPPSTAVPFPKHKQ